MILLRKWHAIRYLGNDKWYIDDERYFTEAHAARIVERLNSLNGQLIRGAMDHAIADIFSSRHMRPHLRGTWFVSHVDQTQTMINYYNFTRAKVDPLCVSASREVATEFDRS